MRALLLGGTQEAAALARLLPGSEVDAVLSLAGRTSPAPAPIPLRVGGFGGADGLARFLRAERFGAVVDATHPFAARISANAEAACDALRLPRLVLARPPWHEPADAPWRHAADAVEAASLLGETRLRVLLTVGRQDLLPFAGRAHRYWVRSVEPADLGALPGATPIVARGPFALADELSLMRRLRIAALVSKNSGASAVAAKLEAARLLGVAVVMIARPPPQRGETVASPEAALAWLADHAGTLRGVSR